MLGSCSINGINCNENECIVDPSVLLTRRRKPKHKFTVAVEGNIGSGKSTFINYFKDSKNVEMIPEPVAMWKSVRGYNTLDLMYKDAQRWSLTFQSYVQLTMLQVHSRKQTKPVKLIERSIFSGRACFIENLYQSGCMPGVDYAVLDEWYQWITKNIDVGVDLIVYLRADPEVCAERIKQRCRKEETGVPMEYLESLHELHENWLIHNTSKVKVPAPVLVLDANQALPDLSEEMRTRQTEILCGNNF